MLYAATNTPNPVANQPVNNGLYDEQSQFVQQPKLFDLEHLLSMLYRSRNWIGAIMAVFIAAGVVVTLLMTPKYRADAAVQIDQEAVKVLGTEQSESSASIQDTERFLKTQVDVINSRTVAKAVATELRFLNDDRFLEAMDVSTDLEPTAQISLADMRREKVIKVLQKNLSVELPPQSRVVRIYFTSPDPQLAARIANSFAENTIRTNLSRKFDSSVYAREFLRDQIDEAQKRLARSEQAAVNYARSKQIIDASAAASANDRGSAPRSLTTGTLVLLNSEAAEYTSKRIAAEQRWNRVRQANLLSLPEVLSNEAVQSLLAERARLNAEVEEELQRRKDGHPSVIQVQAKLQELDRQLTTIAADIRAGIRNEYEISKANEAALTGRVEQLKRSTFIEQNDSIQLSILRREADTFRQQYEFLLARFNQLNAESGVQSNNISLVDAAVTPSRPSSPRILLNLALAFIAGLIAVVLFCYIKNEFFETVRSPEDVERDLKVPLLGVVPNVDGQFTLAEQLKDPKTRFSEALNSFRSKLTMISTHGIPRSLAFTSTMASEGKTTSCAAVAMTLARSGKRVLIIDLDLRRPSLHNHFGMENLEGMSEVLSGNRMLREVLRSSGMDNLQLVTGGAIAPNPADLLEPENIRKLLDQQVDNYDIILVDAPPVLALADAVNVARAVECLAFVVSSGNSVRKPILAALARLSAAHVNVAGILLTKFKPDSVGYGYEYGSTYAYEYHS